MGPVILDIEAYELSQLDREKLQHPLSGGVILFARNYAELGQLKALVADIRDTVKRPFLISVDHEGGRVQRFIDGFTRLPSMQEIEQCAPDLSAQKVMASAAGLVMASELLRVDIDISFAPVLDLRGVSEVIKERSFGESPDTVIDLATAFIQGMHQAGMPATGKHFPGHGSVREDSHIAMPQDVREFDLIEKHDMQVFETLIKQALLQAIMPAHVIYPKVDQAPAGFSQTWLKKVLRQQLKFDGVIFSDDLSMQAASVAGNICERADIALAAGCDLILVCNSPQAAEQVLDYLPQGAEYSQRGLTLLRSLRPKAAFSVPSHAASLSQAQNMLANLS